MTHRLERLHADGPPTLDVAHWPAARAGILARWLEIVGDIPEPVGPRREVLETRELPAHTQQRIVYDAPGGDRVPALLLLPSGPGPWPGMLALHPTADDGKADIATAAGRENRRYGLELVQRGYAVLAPDTITAGERIHPDDEPFNTARFVREHPDESPAGRMIADHRQALSVLSSVPGVDGTRIGVIGHSLGGYNGWFLAGLDQRVAAVVSSCGFATFAGDAELHRWGRRDWFSHLPRLSPFLDRGETPFEFHEILALVATTPLFTYAAMADEYFPHWRPIAAGLDRVHELYRALGASDAMVTWIGHGGHDFPAPVRDAAYAFLDRHLKTR